VPACSPGAAMDIMAHATTRAGGPITSGAPSKRGIDRMRLSKAWALSGALLLCAMSGVAAAKKQEAPTAQLAATHGYVVVSFPKGLGLPPSVLYAPGAVAEPELARFVGVADGKPTEARLQPRPGESNAWGVWLPAGEYRMSGWGAQEWETDARFQVQAGRITDLGSLLVLDVGGYELQVVPVANADLDPVAQRAAKELGPLLSDPQPLQWTPPTKPLPVIVREAPYGNTGLLGALDNKKRFRRNLPDEVASLHNQPSNEALLRQLKSLTPPFGIARGTTADGTAYFPADFGVVRVRKADGTWSSRDTGTLARLHTVAVRNGTLLAGTDTGRVLFSPDDGASWKQAVRMGEGEAMLDISRVGERWMLSTTHYVATDKGAIAADEIRVYAASKDDASDAALEHTFKLGKIQGMMFWFGRAEGAADAYFVNLPDGLQRFDAKSGQWSKVAISDPVTSFRIDATGRVVTAFKMGGFSGKSYVSHDGGVTWKTRARPFLGYNDAMFDADDVGHAFRIEMGPQTERWEMHTYDAAEDKWSRVNFLPIRCRPLHSAGVPDMCITTGLDVYALRDGTWQLDFDAL